MGMLRWAMSESVTCLKRRVCEYEAWAIDERYPNACDALRILQRSYILPSPSSFRLILWLV